MDEGGEQRPRLAEADSFQRERTRDRLDFVEEDAPSARDRRQNTIRRVSTPALPS